MGSNKAAFYFDVEIKRRELLSRLTVAALLAERGHHVFIGERATIDSIKRIIPKATIIKKSARLNAVAVLNDLKNNGFRIINMEEEGVLRESLDEYIGVDMPAAAVGVPDRHLLWGSQQLKNLQHIYPDLVDKFRETGNPRVCLWKHKYYGYYNDLSAKIKEEFGEFVLISSNFGSYTNKRLVDYMVAITGYLSSSANVDVYEENYKVVEFLYNEFVKAAKAISVKGVRVVFRPHPADSVQKIRDDFAGYDNIIVSSEYDVAPWILASKALIHNCCATGLESVLMKKNTIAYTPNSISQYELNEVDKIAKIALNEDELMDCIFSPFEFDSSRINLGGWLNTEVSLDDIVNALEKEQTKSSFELSKVIVSTSRYKLNKILYVTVRKLKDFFIFNKTKRQEVNTLRNKFPVTDSAELIEYLSSIYDAGLLSKPVTCSPVGRNIFYLYCE